MDERNKIIAIQSGSNEMFDELVKTHLPMVYRYLVRLTGNATLAEDLAQETFIRAWKHIDSFNTEKTFRPWLMRIARNCALDELKKKKFIPFSFLSADDTKTRLEQLPDSSPTPVEHAEKEEVAAQVTQALGKLSISEREVLVLHYLEELSVAEVADVLSLPHETTRSRLRRARQAFRQTFEPALHPLVVVNSKGSYASKRLKTNSQFASDTSCS